MRQHLSALNEEQVHPALQAPSELVALSLANRAAASASRRSFLTRGLTAAAVPAAILATSSMASAATKNPLPSFYPGSTTAAFQEIQLNEYSHVEELLAVIPSIGGTPRPFPTFQNLVASTPQQFLTMATAFENTGVHAYFGAAGYIFNPNVLTVAASLAFVEAYHSGFLNNLSNTSLVPGKLTYATPYTVAQVVAAVSPYIASLNDPNNLFPASFGTTKSAANDIEILNFALILEYLEAEFYYLNVPKFF